MGHQIGIRGMLIGVVLAALLQAGPAWAVNSTSPGDTSGYSTIRSIGVEWDIVGDDDHDATATVQYRPMGAGTWQDGLDLVRVDHNGYNMLAGSIFFLNPDTMYDVRLTLTDPDGGSQTRTLNILTRPMPALPVGGRSFHVVPGSGGGDGSEGNPFRGIAAAESAAQPGDIFTVHAGSYGNTDFDEGGAAGNYIVWKAAGDGEATFGQVDVGASYIWLEGLTVRDQDDGLRQSGDPENVVISRCLFYNNHKSIRLSGDAAYWYIVDNIIEGDIPPDQVLDGQFGGEGVELGKTDGHTVAYNRISLTADGISYPRNNVDIHNNDIFHTSDDGIEPDYGFVNIRLWENRVLYPTNNGLSFQPQDGAPWYLIRNQVIMRTSEGPLKYKETDRHLLFHNTLVNVEPGEFQNNGEHWLNAYARNNLFVAAEGSYIYDLDGTISWRTDLDYNGFDWGDYSGDPLTYDGTGYSDLASFASATGLETHGVRFTKESCFESIDFDSNPALTLKSDCNVIDAGEILPNINEDYMGSGPDLGAHERGGDPIQFGPRGDVGGGDPPSDPPGTVSGLRRTDVLD